MRLYLARDEMVIHGRRNYVLGVDERPTRIHQALGILSSAPAPHLLDGTCFCGYSLDPELVERLFPADCRPEPGADPVEITIDVKRKE